MTPAETAVHMKSHLEKYLPLDSNSSSSTQLQNQRKKDHYSHFILRLSFSGTEDLRERFVRVETALFRLRFQDDNARERKDFVSGLNLDLEDVTPEERENLGSQLAFAIIRRAGAEEEKFFKVDWERVPDLVEARKVFLNMGKAYVPMREQISIVVAEFRDRLTKALEVTARALPRLDEDDRLTPILSHLSKNFTTPDFQSSATTSSPLSGNVAAGDIDALSASFPLCMKNLHTTLRSTAHLKHFGRLQYSLFLKGVGLSLPEALVFWRTSFRNMTDDTFNKEYRYNVRHAYGDAGGDSNRRGRGYSPFSCQKILTEHPPGPGETHGCPYRTFSPENLATALRSQMSIQDTQVLREVGAHIENKKFHVACNDVFKFMHQNEIKRWKDEAKARGTDLGETIVHPNEYFRRSYLIKHMGDDNENSVASNIGVKEDVEMGG
jgi:DNA primase large subunit